jgi:hypothetical protein
VEYKIGTFSFKGMSLDISELFQYHNFSLREIYYLCTFNPVIDE